MRNNNNPFDFIIENLNYQIISEKNIWIYNEVDILLYLYSMIPLYFIIVHEISVIFEFMNYKHLTYCQIWGPACLRGLMFVTITFPHQDQNLS